MKFSRTCSTENEHTEVISYDNSPEPSYCNPPYARKKKMAPAGNECYNVFFFDGFYIWFVCISFFGVELGDWFEVVLGPGVMDQPGSEAVGVGAEVDVKFSELFASGDRLWRRDGAVLHVATITQGTTAELSISMSTLATRSLCRLWMSRIGCPP